MKPCPPGSDGVRRDEDRLLGGGFRERRRARLGRVVAAVEATAASCTRSRVPSTAAAMSVIRKASAWWCATEPNASESA
jgi:hypothetical protein